MALPENSTTNESVYNAQLVDISTPSIAYIAVPRAGRLIAGSCTISAAVTVAPAIVTVKKYPLGVAASTVTLGTITVTHTGSAAGLSFPLVITGSEINCNFGAGDTLVFDSDGASTTAAIAVFTAVIRG